MDLKDKYVKISADRYFDLLMAENELYGLQCAGVDNWSGCEYIGEYMDGEDYIFEQVCKEIIE